MGNTLKPPTFQRPKQPPVVIKPIEATIDKNMSIFMSNSEYKRIIGFGGVTQPYSNIYSDCLRLKTLYPKVKILTLNQIYNEFNKELSLMSRSIVDVDTFYRDLDNKTPASMSMIKRFLMNYLTAVIMQIVDIVISNRTNNIINLSLNLPMLNSNMRDAINSTLTSIYDNKVNNISWRSINMNVNSVIDTYINKLSNNNFVANLFRLYTGEISVIHFVRYRSGPTLPYTDRRINTYSLLYVVVSDELNNIENKILPEVKHVVALKIFFDKNLRQLPKETITSNNNFTNYIENLRQKMFVYVLEALYGSNSTLTSTTSTDRRMLLSEIQNLIDKSRETYEYNEEDEEKCTEGGQRLSMYTIHMVFMVLLLFILLVLFLMNDKKRRLK